MTGFAIKSRGGIALERGSVEIPVSADVYVEACVSPAVTTVRVFRRGTKRALWVAAGATAANITAAIEYAEVVLGAKGPS